MKNIYLKFLGNLLELIIPNSKVVALFGKYKALYNFYGLKYHEVISMFIL